ncbi:MAG: geranylgeranylglyceryl/heptaprenylglyceryl phosphate synthase [Bacteroidales bacterium]|nr:geranylgeranylglyceryl/heptaprenylglyceryl phosphate synthase [Bacteroidales bacterium]
MIYESFTQNQKKLALLIDPDKHNENSLHAISESAQKEGVDFIFVGGSLVTSSTSNTINIIKQSYKGPVILFPGNASQVSANADAILFLSLISGRNAEFLIGNHVLSAPVIKNAGLESIPTGYILIDCGKTTSVEYMSNTRPIPYNKPDIAVATALAGELLGLRAIYLEGGSGANTFVNPEIITRVKKACSIPIIVGGGIRTPETLQQIYESGADIAVVGTIIEKQPNLLSEMMAVTKRITL